MPKGVYAVHPTGDKCGSWKGGRVKHIKGYWLIMMPQHPRATKDGYVPEHVLVCEKALGKSLPPGAMPHHIDENTGNNDRTNLVLCQDNAYHKLIHRRMRAYRACGHANWRKCWVCKMYDDPQNLSGKEKYGFYHNTCLNEHRAKLKVQATD